MTTIKCYGCACGEEFYVNDEVCINCGTSVDKSKFIDEPLTQIISQGEVEIEEIPLITDEQRDRPAKALKNGRRL